VPCASLFQATKGRKGKRNLWNSQRSPWIKSQFRWMEWTHLPRILETHPLETWRMRLMSHGRAPEWASSTIFCLVESGKGRPLTNTPPSWFTPLWPARANATSPRENAIDTRAQRQPTGTTGTGAMRRSLIRPTQVSLRKASILRSNVTRMVYWLQKLFLKSNTIFFCT